MTDLAKLVVKLEAQTAKYQRDLEKATGKLDKFTKNTKKSISGIKVAFGGLAFGAVIRKMAQATAKQEQALAQLEAGLKSTGNAAGFSKDQLVKYAEELQKATTFGDEDIISGLSKLTTFTSITGDVFKRTTQAALDLSTRMGTDLKSSIVQLGKAINDPLLGISALSESGVQFNGVQKEMIAQFIETGQVAKAQSVILNELETQFGGSAAAARDTFSGALDSLGDAFGNLLEAPGGMNDSKDTLEEFTAILQDPATVAAANTLSAGVIKAFSAMTQVILAAGTAASNFGEKLARAINGPAFEVAEINKEISDLEGQMQRINNGDFSFVGSPYAQELQANIDQLKEERKIAQGFEDSAADRAAPAAEASMPELDKRIAAPIVNNDVLDKMIAKQAQSVIDANADALERLKDAKADELAATIESLKFEEEKLLESYKRRHESIMSSTEHTETEKKALIIRLNDQTLQEVEVGVQKLHSNIDKDTPAEGFDKLFGSGALVSLFSDLDNIEERFKSLLANIAAQALASGIASALTGGTFGGGFSSSIGEAFGGFKASGGPVSGNTSYVVGERGPELFVPNTGGSIVPNDALGGGSVQTHNYFDIDEALNGFMSTSPAERAVMNIVSRNQRTIRSLSQ